MAPTTREPIHPEVISYESIMEKLVNERTPGVTTKEMKRRTDAHCEPFMTNKDLEHFVQEGNVKATLDKLLSSDSYDTSLPGYIVNHAPKAFLTVIYMDMGADSKTTLQPLEQEGFVDEELPIETHMRGNGRLEVRKIGSSQRLGYFSGWRAKLCTSYESNQWAFLAPTFREHKFSYELEELERLPFVYLPNPDPDGGHFGTVLKLGLRIDHLEFEPQSLPKFQLTPKRNDEYVEVAVKFMTIDNNTTKSDVNKFYPREVETLKVMRELNDPHLIRAIAAYEKGKSRCFIFPWAEGGNLAEFWQDDQSGLDKPLVTWALDQMTGIAGGIMKLHEKNIRHGDIKPLNILYFPDKDKTRRGLMKIADVGLAKVHTEYTKYRVVTTVRMSSERYEPPEMPSYLDREAPLPRRYDCWSLGCVFLEFATWLIYGQKKLESFHRDLSMSRLEKFYERRGNSYPRNEVVNKLINEMTKALPKASALAKLVDLISKHLLVRLDKRMDTETLHRKLGGIRDESNDDSYRSGRLARLVARRPVPVAGTAGNTQPPDKHTSRLDDQWRSIPDSEWSRFLISRVDFPSLRPVVETGFCDACSSIDFLTDRIDLGRTLHDLEEGSEGCSLCSFLFQCFSTVSTETGDLNVDRNQQLLSLSHNNLSPISFYLDPNYKGPVPRQAQLGLPILPKPGSSQQFALLNEWVTLCDRIHDCVSEEAGDQVPTRLIDVGTADAPSLNLVETAEENIKERYVALSHCWGKLSKDERFCTYIENIEGLKKHIPFNRLPQTFKDAVTATRALNIRYLWIDSLCIIQEDAQDWKLEAGRMEDVFTSAYCTIAASSSTSSLGGFLSKRKDRSVIGINTKKGPLYLAEAIDNFQRDVEEGVLNTRGWVFQERALSRRTIHFTSNQVYWECGHGVHCETLAHLRNRESELLGDSKFPSYGLQRYKDESIRLVQYLYKTYSGLNLTNTTDRSKALLGLEKRLGRTFQTRAEYGTLSVYFERLLLWQRDQPLPLDDIPYPEGQGAPSWSWMSLMGKISYLDVPFGKVNWTGDVANPFNEYYHKDEVPWDGGLQVVAHNLAIGEDVLKNRIRTDRAYSEMHLEDFICAVVGTSKLTNDDGTTDHYVLLLQHMSPPCVYERIGVGILLDIHIQPESFPVYVI